jgi:hypothetical protein
MNLKEFGWQRGDEGGRCASPATGDRGDSQWPLHSIIIEQAFAKEEDVLPCSPSG